MDATVLSAGTKGKSLTDEWEAKNQGNQWEAMKIRSLIGGYVKVSGEGIINKKDPETVAAELNEITTELTNLMMSSSLNPARRVEVLKKVTEVSFKEFFPSMMQESPDFSWPKVKIAQEAIGMKPLPENPPIPKPR